MDQDADATDLLDLVARRIDYLEHLTERPRHTRGLVDEFDDSRSTVNRALRELEGAGFVERTGDGYATTATGSLAVRAVREVMETLPAIASAAEFLDPLDPDAPIGADPLVGADIDLAEAPTPYRLLERIEDAIGSATRFRVLLPLLPTRGLLEICRDRVVEGDAAAELFLTPDLFEAAVDQFPGVFAELASGDAAAFTADLPPFAVVLADDGDGTTVGIVAYTESRSVHGVLLNDTPEAVGWAEDLYERVRADATDVTDELRDLDIDSEDRAVSAATGQGDDPGRDSLPVQLEAEGIVRLHDGYFERRDPAPPAVCWRAGLDLVEVHAGYAVDREYRRDGDRRSLTGELIDALEDGNDHVLLGPPGAGKSTVCKSVACRWYERGFGPVFYRESGHGTPFTSVAVLADRLRRADGHALVVVEDAVRAEANAVFELIEEFGGDATVSFLLDAREREWQHPEEFPADARLRGYKETAIETITIPALDEAEVERFVRRFAETIDHDVEVPVDDLLDEIRASSTTDGGGDGSPRAGEVLLLLHRLSSYADPLAKSGAGASTTLTEDVRRTYRRLRNHGEPALDVGVTINLLNAAGIGIHLELVYALADDEEYDAIREALDLLEGRVLFSPDDADPREAGYRTVHESWSAMFLDHLLDVADERAAHDRIGRCVTAMLSLADDRELRERIDWELAGDAPYLAEIEVAPDEWADDFVRHLFALGLEHPGLAPLFGKTGYSSIEPPDACSADVEPRCAYWRGRMYLNSGDFDVAQREFDLVRELIETTDSVSGDRALELEAACYRNLGEVAYKRRRYEDAASNVTRALEIYREIGDDEGEADCLRIRGIVAWLRGDPDTAAEYFTRSLERYRDIDDRLGEAKALNNLGLTARRNGDLDAAEEYLTRSLDIKRDTGDTQEVAKTLNNLGLVTRDRGGFDDAREYFVRSLEIKRRIGDRQGEANTLTNLAIVARRTGDIDDAEEYAEQAFEIYGRVDDPQGEADSRRVLAEVALARGDLVTAMERAERCLDRYREIGDDRGAGRALHSLGRIERERGAHEDAAERLASSIELLRDAGTERDLGDALLDGGLLAHERGREERARARLQEAIECYRTIGAARAALEAVERLIEGYGNEDDPEAAEWRDLRSELVDEVEGTAGTEVS